MIQQFRVVPTIFPADSCKEFCETFQIGQKDLILTNPTYFEGYLDEYVNVLGGLVEEEGENICIRYSGEKPDTSEFEEAVVEVFYRKNLEDKLADMTYKISNNFIILSNGK